MAPSLKQIILVAAGNAVPVVGVHALGWSKDAAVIEYWFDGASALVAAIVLMMPRAMRGQGADEAFGTTPLARAFSAAAAAVVMGLPCWFAALWLWKHVLSPGALSGVFSDPWVLVGLLLVLAGNFWEALERGYHRLAPEKIKEVFPVEFELLLCRVAALMLIASWIPQSFIWATAAALTFVELYPQKAIAFFTQGRAGAS